MFRPIGYCRPLPAISVTHSEAPSNLGRTFEFVDRRYGSTRINDRRRICFSWREGNARDVEIVDYH